VFVDLPGPKLRAHVYDFWESVIHLPRQKDRHGRTLAPTHLSVVPEYRRKTDLPVPPGWFSILEKGDVLEFVDAGGRKRKALIDAVTPDGVHPVGLMIARGDLAVELSFERLAEMQEELLWFGEACHLPVIWATQVLDTVAHSGVPTRAEVTDAAMSMRAECVMLNKGPHIATATRMLSDIIRRMEAHQYKKRSLYRRLSVASPNTDLPRLPA
jgi:hypothetical protein